jgi:hypothetical protein
MNSCTSSQQMAAFQSGATYYGKHDEDIVGTKHLADEGSGVKPEQANAGRDHEEDQVDDDRSRPVAMDRVVMPLISSSW